MNGEKKKFGKDFLFEYIGTEKSKSISTNIKILQGIILRQLNILSSEIFSKKQKNYLQKYFQRSILSSKKEKQQNLKLMITF